MVYSAEYFLKLSLQCSFFECRLFKKEIMILYSICYFYLIKERKNLMKILQISYQTKMKSGGAVQLLRLSKALNESGHEVQAIMGYNSDIDEQHFSDFYDNNINFIRVKLPRLKFNSINFMSIWRLRKYLISKNFEVIHVHKSATADLVFLASLGLNIKFIVNRGVTDKLDFFQSLKYHFPKISKVIAVSEAVKEVMVKSGKISPSKIEVVYGSVDTEEFSPARRSTLRSELNLPDFFIWGFAGNDGERKGLKYLLKAFAMYHEKYPDDKLVLAGVNPESKRILSLDDNLRLSIIPLGFRNDMANCMSGFDAFVFSGIAQEGLTGTVREAASSGLPVISTNIAGNGELVKNRQTGLLVEIKNTKALFDAMCEIRENPEKAEFYGSNIREFVIKEMSNKIRMDKLLKIYRSVLK